MIKLRNSLLEDAEEAKIGYELKGSLEKFVEEKCAEGY